MSEHKRVPKLGLAMSGAAARSSFYIGFLEALDEQGIKIDYIAASSGAAIVAACYACGTLEQLKRKVFSLDRKFIREILDRSKHGGGWYSLDRFEEFLRNEFTKGKLLEAVTPQLTFMAADLEHGEPVALAMGDIAHAARISCTVPVAFEPVQWGSKTLVDGGLLTFMPGEIVRAAGMDVVVGVYVQATKHIFLKKQLTARLFYNRLKKYLGIHYLEVLMHKINPLESKTGFWDYLEDLEMVDEGGEHQYKGLFGVLGRSLDLALEASKENKSEQNHYGCDYLVSATVGNFYSSFDIVSTEKLYTEGRKAGSKHAQNIKQLLLQKEKEV